MAIPVFAPNFTWYKSSVTRPNIISISIVDSYTPTGSEVESWNASDGQEGGTLTAYRLSNNSLIIAGNGSGEIMMNADSSSIFSYSTTSACFTNVTSITGTELLNASNATTLEKAFNYCKKVTSLNLTNWNVENVTSMKIMCQRCEKLTSIGDLTNWNVENVTSMAGMFNYCFKLTSIGDLTNWNVGKVESVQSMFQQCNALVSIGDISNWKTSTNLANLEGMFSVCSSLQNIGNLDNWDVSNVTSIALMFQSCTLLEPIGSLRNWDTSNITSMRFMFYGCKKFNDSLDLSNWDTSKNTSFDHMFAHSYMYGLDVSKWDTSSATNMNGMFHTVQNEVIDVSNFDTSKVISFAQMFEGTSKLKKIIGLENFDTSKSLSFTEMFNGTTVPELNLSSFDTRSAVYGAQISSNGSTSAVMRNMLNSRYIKKITLGRYFSMNGNGAEENVGYECVFPYALGVAGWGGRWYNTKNEAFLPENIPTLTADTYYVVYPTIKYVGTNALTRLWHNIVNAYATKTELQSLHDEMDDLFNTTDGIGYIDAGTISQEGVDVNG